MEAIRTFLGIPVAATAGATLLRTAKSAWDDELRWAPADQLHLTLLFFGDVSADQVADMAQLLDNHQWPPPFRVHTTRIAPFPKASSRILAAHVTPDTELMALQSQLAERLEANGISFDRKPFRPHITLARSRRRLTANDCAANIEYTMADVVLYRSELSNQGSRYSILRQFGL